MFCFFGVMPSRCRGRRCLQRALRASPLRAHCPYWVRTPHAPTAPTDADRCAGLMPLMVARAAMGACTRQGRCPHWCRPSPCSHASNASIDAIGTSPPTEKTPPPIAVGASSSAGDGHSVRRSNYAADPSESGSHAREATARPRCTSAPVAPPAPRQRER